MNALCNPPRPLASPRLFGELLCPLEVEDVAAHGLGVEALDVERELRLVTGPEADDDRLEGRDRDDAPEQGCASELVLAVGPVGKARGEAAVSVASGAGSNASLGQARAQAALL